MEEEEVVDPVVLPLLELVVVAAVMLNSSDCARIVSRSWLSFTRLTRNVPPEGQPALGGFTLVVRRVPTTSASLCGWVRNDVARRDMTHRTRSFCGMTSRFCKIKNEPEDMLGVTIYLRNPLCW